MGDRVSTVIEIGGSLERSLIPELIAAAASDGMGIDWSGIDWSGDEITEAEIQDAVDNQSALYLTGYEINYANLDALEDFCRDHNLTYRKEWEAGGGFGSGGDLVGPEINESYTIGAVGDDPTLNCAEIIKLGSWEAVVAQVERLSQSVPALVIT